MKWQKKYFGVGAERVHWWNRDFVAKSGFLGHKSGLAIFAAILTLGGSACGAFGASSVFAEGLTLTIPETLKLDVNPDLANASGTFGKSAQPSELFASTTTAFGFNLSLKVKDAANGNKLMKGEKSIPSIEAKLTEEAYKGAGNVNTWAYLPSKLAGVANTEYQPGPTTQTVIEETDAANGPELPTSYQMSLAAKINSETEPGTYQNTFVFTLTANSTKYNLVFDLNPAGEASGGPTNISGDSVEATKTVQIGSEVPTREGYEFKGWCTEKTSDENCGGQTIAAGGNYTFNGLKKGNDNTVTLWAMWKQTIPTTMQGFGDYCKNMVQDNGSNGNSISITLRDTRDNNTYTVAKLKDGKCWMTQNLRIQNYTLTSTDSDVSTDFVLPTGSLTNNFNEHNKTSLYVEDSYYGGFYNWYTATAGTGKVDQSLIGRQVYNTDFNAPSSICPTGWKLPNKDDASLFVSNYSYSDTQRDPINLIWAGYYIGNTLIYRSDRAYTGYWLSTGGFYANNTYHPGALLLQSGNSVYYSQGWNHGYGGSPVRCISRQ